MRKMGRKRRLVTRDEEDDREHHQGHDCEANEAFVADHLHGRKISLFEDGLFNNLHTHTHTHTHTKMYIQLWEMGVN